MRRAARVDSNQKEIVKALRKIPGVSVAVNHDDILTGFRGRTYWFEIKTHEKASKQDGQVILDQTWTGHYQIVWKLSQITDAMGITQDSVIAAFPFPT